MLSRKTNCWLSFTPLVALSMLGMIVLSACTQRFGFDMVQKNVQSGITSVSNSVSNGISNVVGPILTTPVCKPVIGKINPTENVSLRWKWETSSQSSFNQLMAPVMVADINGDKVSDFIFVAFEGPSYDATGMLRVVSGTDGKEIWSTPRNGVYAPYSNSHLAVYDLDRDGKPEILTSALSMINFQSGLAIYSSTGSMLAFQNFVMTYANSIEVVDLKHDGSLFIHAGTYVYPFDEKSFTFGTIYSANVEGIMELVPKSPGMELIKLDGVYSSDNKLLYTFPPKFFSPERANVHNLLGIAYGDFNQDKNTDLFIRIDNPLTVAVFNGLTGDPIAEWIEPLVYRNACKGSRSGALNIGDVDGDGSLDVTLAGACRLFALKGDTKSLTTLWSQPSRDVSSSSTGSSIYDFNGDGKVEVLYNDEFYFRIYDGETGGILFQLLNDSGTLYEYPVVVSLKAGDPASIILSANNYTNYAQSMHPDYEEAFTGLPPPPIPKNITGIRVIQNSDQSWMSTRTIWNQYNYTITNVTDSVQVPNTILDFVALSNRTRANLPKTKVPCVAN